MLRRERRHIHTVGVRLRNEERQGGREERAAEPRVRGRGCPHVFSAPLSSPSLQRERPTKRIVSLSFQSSCHPGGGSSLEMAPKFCSPLPRGSPRWAEWPSLRCYRWGRGASVSQPCTSRKQTRPAHRGLGNKINTTLEVKWSCYKSPAGPQGPASMLSHLMPPASPGKSPEWAT